MVYSHVLYNCVGGEFLFTAFQLPFPLAFHLNIQIYPPFPNNNPVDQSYHLIHMVLEYFVWHKMTIQNSNICAGEELPALAVRTRGSGHVHKIKSDQINTHTHSHAHACIQKDSDVSFYLSITVIFQRSPVQHLCSAMALMNPRCCILQDRIIPHRGTADNRSQYAKAGEPSADRVQSIPCYIPPRRLIKHQPAVAASAEGLINDMRNTLDSSL